MTLKQLGAKAKIAIGAQVRQNNLAVPAFVEFVTQNFDLLTPGTELGWSTIRPQQSVFDFTAADWMVQFCQAHGLGVHGHTLCWNSPSGNPAWLASAVTSANAQTLLTDHITKVVSRYAGRVASWGVVNEPLVAWSNNPSGLYPGVWASVIGVKYIDMAFAAARAADPDALLVLNCYGVEQNTGDCIRMRALHLTLFEQLLARGVPVQAIGIESHIDASLALGGPAYATFLKSIEALGLQVLITELDINDTQVVCDQAQCDAAIAKSYYDYLWTTASGGTVSRATFWTPCDRWSWLDSMTSPIYKRPDGQPHRAGLLDTNLVEKPAYSSTAAALTALAKAGA